MRLIEADVLTDTIENIDWYHISSKGSLIQGANSELHIPLYKADDIYKALKEAPAVDAAPVVHGQWIEGKTLEKCSICGKKGFPDWYYCPHCGAKMDGERSKND